MTYTTEELEREFLEVFLELYKKHPNPTIERYFNFDENSRHAFIGNPDNWIALEQYGYIEIMSKKDRVTCKLTGKAIELLQIVLL